MPNIEILQNGVCTRFLSKRRSASPALKVVQEKVRPCVGCSGSSNPDDAECRFFRKDDDGHVIEQRQFVVSPGPKHRLLEVNPYEHSAHVLPQFDPAPPTLTQEMLAHCLIGSAYILVPQLERHLDARQQYTTSIARTPEMKGERLVCDVCHMSCLCGVRLCKCCGMEVCDTCVHEERADSTCASNLSTRKHDFALVEFFQPNELEYALKTLKAVPPPKQLPCPPDADVVKVKLTDGAGAPAYSILWHSLRSGVPLVVSGIDPGDSNLNPDYFIRRHGEEMVTLVNTITGAQRTLALTVFMEQFLIRQIPTEPEKLKDWPPTMFFSKIFPHMFETFEMVLPGSLLTFRKGALNLESSMPEGSCPPDTGPKAYLAHGTTKGATTRLHTDMTDAVNVLFYAERQEDESEGGAQWIMIDRDSMADAEYWLRQWKEGSFEGHPIHSQEIALTLDDVTRLREKGVHVWVFIQRQGDAVFIPAGVGHQVTNLTACIKIAVDFVSPCNVMHSRKIGEELRRHRLDACDAEAEDVLQLATMCWWYFIRSQTEEYRSARRDPRSDPEVSTYSAAPRYLQVPVRADTPLADVDDFALGDLSLHPAPTSPRPTHHELAVIPASIAPDSSLSSFQQPGPSSTIPSKRSNKALDGETYTDYRRRRHNKRREEDTKSAPEKSLLCPIGVCDNCNRPRDYFSQQQLLDHLERSHKKYVTFRHRGLSRPEMYRVRQELFAKFPKDDKAFLNHVTEVVLSKVPVE